MGTLARSTIEKGPSGKLKVEVRRRKTITILFVYLFNGLFEDAGARGGVVVKALRYKPAGREFDSRWCHWNFSVT